MLTNLKSIDGVVSCALFSVDNKCLAHQLSPPYEPILLSRIMSEMQQVFDLVTYLDEPAPLTQFVSQHENGTILIRWIDNMKLIVLTKPDTNLAMVNVGVNVASLKVTEAKAKGTLHEMQAVSAARSQRSVSINTPSSLSMSGAGGDAPPDAVGAEVLKRLLKALARQLGPASKIVLKQEITKMGSSPSTLVAGQYNDLVLMLSRRIPDQSKIDEFLREARTLLRG